MIGTASLRIYLILLRALLAPAAWADAPRQLRR